MNSGFTAIDWAIVGVYMAAMIATGIYFARRQKNTDDYFLAGHRIPVWASALSIVAASVSAATFLGLPEQAFKGNLTYLTANIAGLIAVPVVAAIFVPAFYKAGVTTVYQLIGQRCGPDAARVTSGAFVIGRVLGASARLYMAAIPVAIITFGDLGVGHLITAVLIMTAVSLVYTMLGGLSAVIWTEVPQALLFILAAAAAIIILALRIDAPISDVHAALANASAADGTPKLTILDFRTDPASDFSVWSALFGLTLFNIAVLGTDQDLAQRLLSCKNAFRGSASAVLSQVMGLVVAVMFLAIGALLFVYYRMPEVGAARSPIPPDDSRKVLVSFILTEMPAGLRGLMLAGLFAAAMSSIASSIGAIASTLVVDFQIGQGKAASARVRSSRLATLLSGLIVGGLGCGFALWQNTAREQLITLAIDVLVFAYAGLLGVFLTVILTRRGSANSVTAALLVGVGVVVLLQFGPGVAKTFNFTDNPLPRLSMGWRMLAGTIASFLVCMLGARRSPVAA